jgi:hypothetical protein
MAPTAIKNRFRDELLFLDISDMRVSFGLTAKLTGSEIESFTL